MKTQVLSAKPEAEIFIQEYEIYEKNASNKIDRNGNQSSKVPPCLPGHLLLQDRVSMEEGEDQATADYDPCPMLKHRLHKDDQKKGDISGANIDKNMYKTFEDDLLFTSRHN